MRTQSSILFRPADEYGILEHMETNTRGQLNSSLLRIEDDERHVEQADDFIARNRDALNDSISRSRHQVSEGRVARKAINELIEEGRTHLENT
jgi:uncharacterized coiled-coil DUF342 family protein